MNKNTLETNLQNADAVVKEETKKPKIVYNGTTFHEVMTSNGLRIKLKDGVYYKGKTPILRIEEDRKCMVVNSTALNGKLWGIICHANVVETKHPRYTSYFKEYNEFSVMQGYKF